ncbi:EamA family transporter [Synechococcus sp. M16CYN]|uniref:EamA family transporter n=1 Tax=Synechococcus sp. M16CYN TaxID=3103139 RepID=UPI0032553CC5
MISGLVAALGAAMAWTGASSMWRSLSLFGTAVELNGLKNGLATLLFLPLLITLPWTNQFGSVLMLLFSGLIGIGVGDSFHLGGLRRLGTQRVLTVEASEPVLANLGGFLLMGDTLQPTSWLGAILVSCSVVLVASQSDVSKSGRGRRLGLTFSILAVLCGLIGAFMARQALIVSNFTPFQSAAVRLLGGWLGLLPVLRGRLYPEALPPRIIPKILLATVIGTNIGIVLQQVVFQTLPVGEGVTLMSTAPVMALLISRMEGEMVQWRGVAAAVFVVFGVALSSL